MVMDMGAGTTTMAMDMGTATTSMAMDMTMHMGSSTAASGMAMGSGMAGMASGASSGMAMASATSMPMSMPTKPMCSMSMLWNWNTKNVCFIAESWQTTTKALFAGTCLGVFGLLIAMVWWRRLLAQYKHYITVVRQDEVTQLVQLGAKIDEAPANIPAESNVFMHLFSVFNHNWLLTVNQNLAVQKKDTDTLEVYPSIFEHTLMCVGDTIEWSAHHCVMLLFMYFNGYVFISAMIGAGIGWFLFGYNRVQRMVNVDRRCCL